MRMSRRITSICIGAAVVAWIGGIAWGASALVRYSLEPGPAGIAPAVWPGGALPARDPNRHTLVLFLHPRCPCSRATLAEVERLAARAAGACEILVVFTIPPGESEAWARTGLWDAAARIPGARRLIDRGALARAFGVRTSGGAVLYTPDGRLAFAGGLTAARGHEGPSPGQRAVLAVLRGERAGANSAPVFGCPLEAESPPDAQESNP